MPSEWVLAGALNGHRHQVEKLSCATGMAVLAIDYCLAPEHLYSGGLNDCVVAWLWLLENGPSGAGAPDGVFLAGNSAGGNLAFALMLRLRDVDQRLPKVAAAFAPVTDFTDTSLSMLERIHLDPAMLTWVVSL